MALTRAGSALVSAKDRFASELRDRQKQVDSRLVQTRKAAKAIGSLSPSHLNGFFVYSTPESSLAFQELLKAICQWESEFLRIIDFELDSSANLLRMMEPQPIADLLAWTTDTSVDDEGSDDWFGRLYSRVKGIAAAGRDAVDEGIQGFLRSYAHYKSACELWTADTRIHGRKIDGTNYLIEDRLGYRSLQSTKHCCTLIDNAHARLQAMLADADRVDLAPIHEDDLVFLSQLHEIATTLIHYLDPENDKPLTLVLPAPDIEPTAKLPILPPPPKTKRARSPRVLAKVVEKDADVNAE